MTAGYLPLIGTALTHGPWTAGLAALAVTPVGFAAIAAVLERRWLRPAEEFVALILGDPLLAVSVALGTWLLGGATPGYLAGPPFGVACLSGSLAFGLLQWRAELRSGFYTPAQAAAPTKIWHQVVVYPVLGYWLWTADLGGLLTSGSGVSHTLTKVLISGCVLIWLLANVYDRRHPKLGHPPYNWRRLRPWPPPWAAQSISLRARQPSKPRHRSSCAKWTG
jgi:hypothetical protein